MNQHFLRILVVEDSPEDTELLMRHLRRAGYHTEHLRVDDPRSTSQAMDRDDWDLIITDYLIPGFGGLDALEIYKQKKLDVPFIVLSGHIGEDMIVKMMKAGAHDCIMKDNLTRLVPAIERELRDAVIRRERREAERALRESEERFRELADNIDSTFFMFECVNEAGCNPVLYANAAFERIWGRTREELYNDGRAWLKAVHPEDLAEVERNLPLMARGEFNLEFRIFTSGLKTRWVHFRAFPVMNTDGSVYRIAGIAQDVTGRREADEQIASNARQLDQLVEELKTIDRQLHDSHREVWESRRELERRVHERTAGLAVVNAELQSQIRARTQLESELIEMADRERHRRGMDTHAKLSQKLMGIAFMLKALERKISRKNLPRVIETRRIQNLLNEVINHSDDLAQDFGSLDLKGGNLARELKSLAANVRKIFQISCHFLLRGIVPKLPQQSAAQLYKIAQDAAGNAIKNGHATVVTISLFSEPGGLRLEVKDNGMHLPASRNSKDSTGWRIMHSRASLIGASLQIQQQETQGIVVTCVLPTTKSESIGCLLPVLGQDGDFIQV